jgi:Spy/CpxP family protein refolding chaperone
MTRDSKIIIAVIVLALLSYIPAFAQHPEHQGKPGCGSASMPELTIEQEKQIADLKMKLIKETEPIKTELKIKQMELQALWKEDNPDAKKILAKTKEISALRASLQEKMINHKLAILKILTPEQRKMMKGKMGMRCMGCYDGDGCGMGSGCGMHGEKKDAGCHH